MVWVSSKTAALQRKMKQHNDWSEENFTKRTSKQLKKLQKLGKKCAHLGIDIQKIIIEPKTQTEDEKAAGSSKSAKRKGESGDQKKVKKQPKLEDLLGNTIQEDSEDEDYIAIPEDDEGQSSDEESYGFLKDAGEEEDDEGDSEDEEEESDAEEQIPVKSVNKSKTNFSKSLKASNIERFDQMLKRKPHSGGIQKQNKKPVKSVQSVKAKNNMQLSAAKEVAKPLSKVKGGKMAKGLNPSKKSKKVK